ncbi:MAG TPA: hypothetical protein VG916_14450 [Gemmatimonadaceae bacterium]|nr:hypothetical protein [Gemmatimonadaceae bacterium]
MKKNHDKRPSRVAEPVQVYLAPGEHARLDRLTAHLDATKSDVIRRALEALEREVADPARHPVLQLVGIADDIASPDVGYDVAVEHDRFLAESEMASWTKPAKATTPSRHKRRGR